MLAIGVDVSATRGLDIVALDDELTPVVARRRQTLEDLATLIGELSPDIIAIDSPPAWSRVGKSRVIERQLVALGIHIFATPADGAGRAFYSWMEVGFRVFEGCARLGYPLFVGSGSVVHMSIEVFPHASAVVLRGAVPAARSHKLIWRRDVLEAEKVRHEDLTTVDQIDAALAALTAIRALEQRAAWVGTEGESVLVLPVASLPLAALPRDPGTPKAAHGKGERLPLVGSQVPTRFCGCGCRAQVRRR